MDRRRNYKIDLLKTLAMFMVIVEHMLIYTNLKENSVNNSNIYWALRCMCKMNVNLFIICSAVLLRNREFKFCRFIKIILYTVIISILSILCYLVIGDESIGKKDIIKSFFPVLSNSFWFITCYLGLYLLYPIINKFIDGFKGVKIQIIIALLIYFVLFMYPNCFLVNSIVNNGGRSIVWMIVLYICTNAIGNLKIKTIYLQIVFLGSFIILLFSTLALNEYGISNPFLSNESPLVLCMSISFFMILSKKHIDVCNNSIQRIFTILSSATLTVYLVHENICRDIIWNYVNDLSNYYSIIYFLIPIIIYFFGIIVSLLLNIITNPIMKTKSLHKLSDFIDSIYDEL